MLGVCLLTTNLRRQSHQSRHRREAVYLHSGYLTLLLRVYRRTCRPMEASPHRDEYHPCHLSHHRRVHSPGCANRSESGEPVSLLMRIPLLTFRRRPKFTRKLALLRKMQSAPSEPSTPLVPNKRLSTAMRLTWRGLTKKAARSLFSTACCSLVRPF